MLDRLAAIDVAVADRAVLCDMLDGIRRVRARLDGLEAAVARRLEAVSSYPEKVLADRSAGSLREAEAVLQRSATLTAVPVFEAALGDGTITSGHVDVLGRGLRQLEPVQRIQLLDQADQLAVQAAASSVEDF